MSLAVLVMVCLMVTVFATGRALAADPIPPSIQVIVPSRRAVWPTWSAAPSPRPWKKSSAAGGDRQQDWRGGAVGMQALAVSNRTATR